MPSNSVLSEIDARGVAFVTLNRPEVHNAINDHLVSDLTEELLKLGEDPTVRVVILRGAGKSFSVGADLNWLHQIASHSIQENHTDALCFSEMMKVMDTLTKPTIALVHGRATGTGLGLMCCADVAIASEETLFSLPEVRYGLIPAIVGPYVYSALGARQMRRYMLTSEAFSAKSALEMGIIQDIVATPEDLLPMAEEFIYAFLKAGPNALKSAKKLFRLLNPVDEKLQYETAKQISTVRVSEEAREGISAFLEKRTPYWWIGD